MVGMKKLKVNIGWRSLLLIGVAVALVIADLLTKYFAKKDLWDLIIIPGFVEIDASVPNNPGCAFSFLNEHPEIGQPLLITVTFVLLAALIFAFIVLPERFMVLKVAITLVSAGAIGNLVDRLMYRSVRDFFGLNMFGMVYCNFADFFIVIGTVLAVIDLLFLNEWALVPLTKRAKEAQAEHKDKPGEEGKSDGE